MTMSNSQVAARTGYHHTMVSRVRNGHRMPSTGMLARICREFDLDHKKYLDAYQAGAESFSALLRAEVFDAPDEESVESESE